MSIRSVRTILLALLPFLGAGTGSAQVIGIKTVPVATGDQFLIFPSERLGMGGVSIALSDTLGDPFANPATLTRLDGPRLFGAPTAYGITNGNGGAITLPMGGLFSSSSWSGGIGVALQEIDPGGDVGAVFPLVDPAIFPPAPNQLSQKSRTNLYGFAALARSLGGAGTTSVGASVAVADLSALGGVDLLYARQTVGQDGHTLDLRLGLTSERPAGDVLEAVLVHSRLDMRHQLVDLIWIQSEVDTLPQDHWPWEPEVVETTELDQTNTWGLHLGWTRPLDADGWLVGAIVTGNYKSHPKIPNYTLMSIPRDPGDSWAYDLGVGISKQTERAVFGFDVIYEPIWTETWADAAEPLQTVHGDTIPAGTMTVFNDFRFDNAIFRMGVAGRAERVDLQFGLEMKAYRYTLDQTDFVLDLQRRQREDWMEWRPSLALGVRFDDFAIHYTGRITAGTGRPGVAWPWGVQADAATRFGGADFLPAPSGALTLADATVHTHQLSVSIPLGR